jgi:SAM-dependent methyltransferase
MEITADLVERIAGLDLDAVTRGLAFKDLPRLVASPVTRSEHDRILASVEETIAARRFRVIGFGDDQQTWGAGWQEIADQLRRADRIALETLRPQYFPVQSAVRCLGEYWSPETDHFEYYLGVALRRALMAKAFQAPTRIVELGCGTGLNLALAAELFPEAQLFGADWAPASLEILAAMASAFGRDIRGAHYNMLAPEDADELPIDSQTDVLTVHALEQLGVAGPHVIDMLLKRPPRTVLHIEPILEFYDRADPLDAVAARYHLERGYLIGLADKLDGLAARGEIEITMRGRVRLGNLYHDAYSYIAWRPKT